MTRDIELLLTCLGKGTVLQKEVRLLHYSSEDWEEAAATARRHGLEPILFHNLKQIRSRLDIPAGIWQELHRRYFVSASRNIFLYRQLLHLLDIFNREGIPVILLKGAHLAELIYKNPALRPMLDIDLLVKHGDLARVHTFLLQEGYDSSEQNQGTAFEHLAPYLKKGAVRLEIHFHITEPPFSMHFDIASLWERARKETFQNVSVLTLSPEDLLLHLCIHTSIHHGFDNGLLPYLDIALALEHYQEKLDWDKLWTRAKNWGMDRSVYLMLALTGRLLGHPMPKPVVQDMPPDQETQNAVQSAIDLVFHRSAPVTPYVARLFAGKGWRKKIKYLIQRTFPARSIMLASKERTGNYFLVKVFRLYLLRLRSLLQTHGKTVWSGLRRDPETLAAIRIQNRRNDLIDWIKTPEHQRTSVNSSAGSTFTSY